MSPKWRWRIADLLNRLPFVCWPSLVDWVMLPTDKRLWHLEDGRILSDVRVDQRLCREDAQRVGNCYCNKLGADGKCQ